MTLTSEIPRPSTVLLHSWRLLAVSAFTSSLAVAAAGANSTLLHVDEPVSDFIRHERLTEFYRTTTDLGATELAIPFSIIFGIVLWNRCRPLAIAFPTLMVVGLVINAVLKVIIDRPRPPSPLTGTALASFPSGHTIQATLVLGMLPPALFVLTRRNWVFWIGTAVLGSGVVITAVSRVGLGAHWPTDVIGGVLIGVTLLLTTEYILSTRWARRQCPECALHLAHPPDLYDPLTGEHIDPVDALH